MAHPSEDHHQPVLVGGGDDLLDLVLGGAISRHVFIYTVIEPGDES